MLIFQQIPHIYASGFSLLPPRLLAISLRDALDLAATDSSIRAVRIRGNGRAFCAGRDVSEEPTERDLELVQAVSKAIVGNPKPVFAAVHGWTVGAGLEWMLNADIVYASEDARFKLPEASLGVFVTGGLVATLPAAIGLSRAKALMLLGEEFSPRQAADWGLVYKTLPNGELDAVTLWACHRLAELKPQVAMQFKRVLKMFGLERFDRAIDEESNVQRRGLNIQSALTSLRPAVRGHSLEPKLSFRFLDQISEFSGSNAASADCPEWLVSFVSCSA